MKQRIPATAMFTKAPAAPSCYNDPEWCIQGIFIDANEKCQVVYRRETTKLASFSGLVGNYCMMCGRLLGKEIL